ncbi:YgaP family membrane protein [Cytobacillus gottheilii]|uniref:DUF2892 domain-containing protein n=1 Tax=Cytobacillus gottheilii TaxID=859144 RepID=A0ABX8FD37_9BACI|nr:DUF2892 domain-containing protein [Cytobacillus gottheilii]QVY62040.1 DUF2892 domain-containing protein [Cytobacillus gottheilii]
MKITPNIGILSALLRITCGLTILSWSTAKLVKFPWRDSYLVASILGAMKVAEGIVRYCPIVALYDKGQEMMHERKENTDEDSIQQMLPHNPINE